MSVWTSHALLWGLLAIGVPAGFGLCALIRAVGRLPDHLEARLVGEQPDQPRPHDGVVVRDEQPDHDAPSVAASAPETSLSA